MKLTLNHSQGIYLKKSSIFVETGHGLTDLVIDATELKFQSASNLEMNSLMFSNYKNTKTGKALVGISPNGGGILFSGILPGSISDLKITKECRTVHLVEQ